MSKRLKRRRATGMSAAWAVAFVMLLCITCGALGVTAWSLSSPRSQVLTPDYAPQEEDENAIPIPNESPQDQQDKPEPPSEGGGSVSMTYSPSAAISLSTGKVSLMFQNPSRSSSDVVLLLVIQEQVLAESGKLVPGKMIQELELKEGAAELLQAGTYQGAFVVQPYNPESAEKAMLDSQCLVTVTVLP